MALRYPSDLPPEHRQKPPFDYEAMFSGLLMGVAVLAFAACLLFVINGMAEEWLRALKEQGGSADPGVRMETLRAVR